MSNDSTQQNAPTAADPILLAALTAIRDERELQAAGHEPSYGKAYVAFDDWAADTAAAAIAKATDPRGSAERQPTLPIYRRATNGSLHATTPRDAQGNVIVPDGETVFSLEQAVAIEDPWALAWKWNEFAGQLGLPSVGIQRLDVIYGRRSGPAAAKRRAPEPTPVRTPEPAMAATPAAVAPPVPPVRVLQVGERARHPLSKQEGVVVAADETRAILWGNFTGQSPSTAHLFEGMHGTLEPLGFATYAHVDTIMRRLLDDDVVGFTCHHPGTETVGTAVLGDRRSNRLVILDADSMRLTLVGRQSVRYRIDLPRRDREVARQLLGLIQPEPKGDATAQDVRKAG